MCAYTKFLIAFNAAVSGVGQGGVFACASAPVQSSVAIRMHAVLVIFATVLKAGLRVLALDCAERKIEDQNGGQQKSQRELAGLFDSAKQFRMMVAGAGFEPTTFGL